MPESGRPCEATEPPERRRDPLECGDHGARDGHPIPDMGVGRAGPSLLSAHDDGWDLSL